MRTLSSSTMSLTLRVGLVAASILLAPAACFYPNYTFNEGAATGGSGGGSGGGSSGEDCTNGVDDNGDGNIDCADPGCGDFACVSDVPQGWEGFYALFEGQPGDDPGCPAAFSVQGFAGNADLVIPTPGCPACECATPTQQSCTLPLPPAAQVFVSSKSCDFLATNPGGACGRNRDVTTDGVCVATQPIAAGTANCADPVMGMCAAGMLPCNLAIRVSQPIVTGGSCTASQTPMPIPLAWSKLALGCRQPTEAPVGQGCSGGQVCIPKAPAPFQSNVCVKAEGDAISCPALFPNQHTYYGGFNDARGCGECSCGSPTGASCTTKIQFFTDNLCTPSALLTEVVAGTCEDLTNNPGVAGRKAVGTQISPGSCTPSGGEVSGAAAPSAPTTFCCK